MTSIVRLVGVVAMIGASIAALGARDKDAPRREHRATHEARRIAAPKPIAAPISVTVSWLAPDTNTDGSVLTDLAGYHIHLGVDPDSLATQIDVPTAGLTDYVVEDLDKATTYYFSISAYNSSGVESADSAVVSLTTN